MEQFIFSFFNSLSLFFVKCREERYDFIRAKYVDKRYVMNTCTDERDLLSDLEHAVNNRDLQQLLQVFAENVDLAAPLPTSVKFYTYDRYKVYLTLIL